MARTPSQRLRAGSSLERSPIRNWRMGLPYFSGDTMNLLLDFDKHRNVRDRGGSWLSDPTTTRISSSYRIAPRDVFDVLGFRPCVEIR